MVFCEGTETEPEYLKGLKSLESVHNRTALTIEPDRHFSAPLRLVEAALEPAEDDEIDEVWCIFDVEAPEPHPDLNDALARAATSLRVKIALSHPCFELWLLLHQRDQTAELTTRQAIKAVQKLKGVSGKHIDVEQFLLQRNEAARRARLLDERHERDGTPTPANPSTGVYRLLGAVDPEYGDGSGA